MMPTSEAEYILYKILLSVSLLIKDLFSIHSGIHLLYARKFCRRPPSEVSASEQSRYSASVERAVLVYSRSVQIQYNKRNRNGGRNDFLLKRNTGRLCKTGL